MKLREKFKVNIMNRHTIVEDYCWRKDNLPLLIFNELINIEYYHRYGDVLYYETKEDAYKSLTIALDKLELKCYRSFEYFSKNNLESLKSAIEKEIDKYD